MKNRILNVMLFCLVFCLHLPSQNNSSIVCNSKSEKSSSRSVDLETLHHTYALTGSYCVNVRLHKITQAGISAIDDSIIESHIASLNDWFDAGTVSQINFVSVGQVQEHDYDDIFSNDLVITDDQGTTSANFSNIINIASLDDQYAIDLYFSNEDLGGGSTAYNIADRTIAFININHLNTIVVAHEVGHLLGLFHTYHGTIGGGNINAENDDGFGQHPPECASDVTGYENKGDYVIDTLGDAGHYDYILNFDTCTAEGQDLFNYCSDDGPQTYPSISLSNIMRSVPSGYFGCWESFTPYQIYRMIYFLDRHFSELITNCPTVPVPCHTCNQNKDGSTANQISGTLSMSRDCLTGTLGLPDLFSNHCNTPEFFIEWANGSTFLNANTSPITMNFSSGNSSYTITPVREGLNESCTFEFNTGCTIPCDNCITVMDAISTSLYINSTTVCTTASVTIPDIDGCYSGYINWGDSYFDLQSGQTMSHTYPTGTFQIEVMLTSLESGRRCRKWVSREFETNRCRSANDNLVIRPNPIKPNQELQFSGIDSKEITKIEILDMLGNPQQFIQRTPSYLFIGNLKPGIYFVKFYTAKGIEQKKLIIE